MWTLKREHIFMAAPIEKDLVLDVGYFEGSAYLAVYEDKRRSNSMLASMKLDCSEIDNIIDALNEIKGYLK